ncbi:MAG: diguanylate cyclase, partial [Oscillospiraceae bacterium]|nr:diguanylate cyclase [Oscillospiraceae bacterium]
VMNVSLKRKAALAILSLAGVISVLSILAFDRVIHSVIVSQYEARSIEIASLVAAEIDPQRMSKVQQAVREVYDRAGNKVMSDQWGTPAFDAYVSQYAGIENLTDHRTLRADLRRMQDVLDVDCLYIVWLDVVNECIVYLIDASYEDVTPVGCIDPIFAEDAEALSDPRVGFAPNITNTPEYGWLIATGMPICDEQGEVIAIAAVDISMNEVVAQQRRFVGRAALAFLGIIAIVCLFGIGLVNRVIVRPINTLSQAARQYAGNRKAFSALKLSGGDEIGVLAASMAHMAEEINTHISSLEQMTNDLIRARERADEMDRAANVDALTKVRNKRAFDAEVQRLDDSERPYALVMIDMNGLKAINDTYGHEAGNNSIKAVCRTVCRTFRHSQVYRLGGDEFVALLEGDDYEDRVALLRAVKEAFAQNAASASLPAWERVTAAVGLAEYIPGTGERADSVFKRADAAMYQHKKAMKEQHREG